MSKIEWTDETWNPVVGCSVVSPGCTNCYAMRLAARLEKMGNAPHYAGLTKQAKGKAVWAGKVAQAPEKTLIQPLRWREPRRVFVDSMGDLFHENVPDAAIDRVFAVMALAERHTFQVLTKRSTRMRAYFRRQGSARLRRSEATPASPRREVRDRIQEAAYDLAERHHPDPDALLVVESVWFEWPLPNVWLGVSAEDQVRADARIPDLLDTPAAVRFVSAEPLLEPIDFTTAWHGEDALETECWGECGWCDRGYPPLHNCARGKGDPTRARSGLDQIIVGGESGPGARPMHPDWARSIRDQCVDAGVAFFFKQWGAWAPDAPFENIRRRGTFLWPDGRRPSQSDLPAMMTGDYDLTGAQHMTFIGKTKAGRRLDGREWNEVPGIRNQGSEVESEHEGTPPTPRLRGTGA